LGKVGANVSLKVALRPRSFIPLFLDKYKYFLFKKLVCELKNPVGVSFPVKKMEMTLRWGKRGDYEKEQIGGFKVSGVSIKFSPVSPRS